MKKLLKYLKARPLAIISLVFILILYFFMIFAEFIAPYSPTTIFEESTFHPSNIEINSKGLCAREFRVLNPSSWEYAKVKGLDHKISFFVKGEEYKLFGLIKCGRHLFGLQKDLISGESYPVFLFGADNLGRDIFSRLVYGSRISLTIGFVASFISLVLAVFFGGIAGFFGGIADWSIMRFSEFFMLVPGLYLILFLRSLLNNAMDSGTSYMIITLILSLVGWPSSARTFRGIVHSIKREDFVENAKLEKIPSLTIIFKYIIPQISSLLIVSTTLSIPGFIMSETTLSYLGLGIADPAVSWGSMINREISTISNLRNFPWLLLPVFLLLAVTLAFNFFGDALRDYFDPYSVVFKRRKNKKSLFAKENPENINGKKSFEEKLDSSNIISIRNLKVTFEIIRGKEKISINSVRGISYDLKKGEVLGIVGESGSGKSVSSTAITGLLPENAFVEGNIFFNNGSEFVDLLSISKKEYQAIRGKKIGMIFQESSSAFDPLQNIGKAFFETFLNSNPKITKEESDKKAVKLLSEVGISDGKKRLENYPHQFSGGQLQRISIALSLAQNCEVLIADEPTTALDVTIQAQIVELLLQLKKSRGLSIIFISHSIELVRQISDRIIVMYGGKIMENAETKKIISAPKNPYTKALLSSSPEFGSHYTNQKLSFIPGKVSDAAKKIEGCPFATRCFFAKDECNFKNYKCPQEDLKGNE